MFYNKYLKYKTKYQKLLEKYDTNIRQKLFTYFHDTINPQPYFFNIISTIPKEILIIANTSYDIRPKEYKLGIGLYYKSDYSEKIHTVEDNVYLPPNPKYWELNTAFNIFAIKDIILPSDAIRAWFNGPTITECANVIQATFYMYILNKFGDILFNKKFGNPV